MRMKNSFIRAIAIISTSLLFACFIPGFLMATEIALSKGQTVYAPVYSNVIAGSRQVPVHLSNTLIIRNTDIHNEIQVMYADYYDIKGRLIKKFYSQPVKLAPLETIYIYLSEGDKRVASEPTLLLAGTLKRQGIPP